MEIEEGNKYVYVNSYTGYILQISRRNEQNLKSTAIIQIQDMNLKLNMKAITRY